MAPAAGGASNRQRREILACLRARHRGCGRARAPPGTVPRVLAQRLPLEARRTLLLALGAVSTAALGRHPGYRGTGPESPACSRWPRAGQSTSTGLRPLPASHRARCYFEACDLFAFLTRRTRLSGSSSPRPVATSARRHGTLYCAAEVGGGRRRAGAAGDSAGARDAIAAAGQRPGAPGRPRRGGGGGLAAAAPMPVPRGRATSALARRRGTTCRLGPLSPPLRRSERLRG